MFQSMKNQCVKYSQNRSPPSPTIPLHHQLFPSIFNYSPSSPTIPLPLQLFPSIYNYSPPSTTIPLHLHLFPSISIPWRTSGVARGQGGQLPLAPLLGGAPNWHHKNLKKMMIGLLIFRPLKQQKPRPLDPITPTPDKKGGSHFYGHKMESFFTRIIKNFHPSEVFFVVSTTMPCG